MCCSGRCSCFSIKKILSNLFPYFLTYVHRHHLLRGVAGTCTLLQVLRPDGHFSPSKEHLFTGQREFWRGVGVFSSIARFWKFWFFCQFYQESQVWFEMDKELLKRTEEVDYDAEGNNNCRSSTLSVSVCASLSVCKVMYVHVFLLVCMYVSMYICVCIYV